MGQLHASLGDRPSNVDFYSGFVYSMLDIPQELVSLLFVSARMVGWLAHNIEDKCSCDKIIRPATKYVGEIKTFADREDREHDEGNII